MKGEYLILEFDQILGNELIKKSLRNTESLNTTLLFLGPEGIGKGLFAKALAKKIMASEDDFTKKRIDKENHPDFYSFYPDPLSDNHLIEKIRYMIEEVYKPPFEAKRKVFVIHEAEKMLPSSSNALLKTLEEPTLDSTIILLASKKEKLLPTIISRCMNFSFNPLLEEEVCQYLEKNYQMSSQDSQKFSKRAEGSIGRAITLSQNLSYQKKEEHLFALVNDSKTFSFFQNAEKLQAIIDEEKKEKTFQKSHIDLLLSQLLLWYRDIYLVSFDKELFFPELKEILLKNAPRKPSFEKIQEGLDKIDLALERNMKFSTCLMDFFLNL